MRDRSRAKQPMVCTEMDIKGPLPKTDRVAQYILVMQDSFPQFAEMFPITKQTTNEVCGKLLEWLIRTGITSSVHSDHGSKILFY